MARLHPPPQERRNHRPFLGNRWFGGSDVVCFARASLQPSVRRASEGLIQTPVSRLIETLSDLAEGPLRGTAVHKEFLELLRLAGNSAQGAFPGSGAAAAFHRVRQHSESIGCEFLQGNRESRLAVRAAFAVADRDPSPTSFGSRILRTAAHPLAA